MHYRIIIAAILFSVSPLIVNDAKAQTWLEGWWTIDLEQTVRANPKMNAREKASIVGELEFFSTLFRDDEVSFYLGSLMDFTWESSEHDEKTAIVRVTPKGQQIYKVLKITLEDDQLMVIDSGEGKVALRKQKGFIVDEDELEALCRTMESTWEYDARATREYAETVGMNRAGFEIVEQDLGGKTFTYDGDGQLTIHGNGSGTITDYDLGLDWKPSIGYSTVKDGVKTTLLSGYVVLGDGSPGYSIFWEISGDTSVLHKRSTRAVFKRKTNE